MPKATKDFKATGSSHSRGGEFPSLMEFQQQGLVRRNGREVSAALGADEPQKDAQRVVSIDPGR